MKSIAQWFKLDVKRATRKHLEEAQMELLEAEMFKESCDARVAMLTKRVNRLQCRVHDKVEDQAKSAVQIVDETLVRPIRARKAS